MNNDELNLVEILKDVPRGTTFYCTMYGDVQLHTVVGWSDLPIEFYLSNGDYQSFTSNGHFDNSTRGECVIFPSRDNRDWSTYKYVPQPKHGFKPYDKVLVRDNDSEEWKPSFYWCYDNSKEAQGMPYRITEGSHWAQCIPYKGNGHLIGTTDMSKGGEE